MAEYTAIEWCHHTMNFWLGCTALSPACDHCYAESWAKRTGNPDLWQGLRRRTSAALWRQPAKWNARCAALGMRERVFTNSLADFFDNQVPPEWRRDAWATIAACPHLDWMPLTKRPENIPKMLPDAAGGVPGWGDGWSNVWLGTTVEDRARKRRIEALRKVPAAVRFLSIEPLLEGLGELDLDGVDLVIVGGESGPNARPMHPQWARDIRDQCAVAGVAFHFKQHGAWADAATAGIVEHGPVTGIGGAVADWMHRSVRFEDGSHARLRGHSFTPHATDLVFRVGKKAAGRLLDGVEHNGMLEVRHVS